jgi:hypothetical protein
MTPQSGFPVHRAGRSAATSSRTALALEVIIAGIRYVQLDAQPVAERHALLYTR